MSSPPGLPRAALAAALFAFIASLAPAACQRAGDPATELNAQVASLLPRLEELSGLERLGPIRVAARQRSELREYVVAQLEEQLPPELLLGLERSYRAFGLLPDTLDLEALLLDLYTEQIVGYYDPRAKTLFVVDDVPPRELRTVLAHELVHALQDQHADLRALVGPERGNDRRSAAQAAIEGHATVVMFALMAEELAGAPVDITALPSLGERIRPALEAAGGDFPVLAGAPRIIRETLLFPYLAGAGFVQELWREARARDGTAGAEEGAPTQRPAPLDTLMPLSTEQVLHPRERFIERRDDPTVVVLEPPGPPWRVIHESDLGQLEISILLREHLGEPFGAAARGWDGDRYLLLGSEDGSEALVWYSVWDDEGSADRFAREYRRILSRRAGRHGSVTRLEGDGRPLVLVVEAAREIELEALPTIEVLELREMVR